MHDCAPSGNALGLADKTKINIKGGTMAHRVIECRDVWKLFGPNAAAAMHAIRTEQLSKAQVLKRFDCIGGIAGVDLEVERGEIFCIMGLSGSGKSTLVRHINRLIEPT